MSHEIFSLPAKNQSSSVSVSGMDVAWFEDGQAQEVLQSFFVVPDYAYRNHQVSSEFQMVWL